MKYSVVGDMKKDHQFLGDVLERLRKCLTQGFNLLFTQEILQNNMISYIKDRKIRFDVMSVI